MIDLSILVCSVLNRHDTFLPKIQKQLHDQYEALSAEDKERVEVIVLTDNKKMMLGHKRNTMIGLAQGKYVQFVDDDDRIADDFIKALLDATQSDADSIVFQAEVSINGAQPKICYYSKDYKSDYNANGAFYRIPNHICCIKKSVSLKSSFPNIMYGEDSGYSKLLVKYLRTEHKIDRVLYYYDYNATTSETQQHRPNKSRTNPTPPIVDVIMLSRAITGRDRMVTQQAINSCVNGANGLSVNVIVLEQGRFRHYSNAKTVTMRKHTFNYNGFANYGASLGSAPWVMIANNDLVFQDGWLHLLLAAEHPVVSPHEPTDPRQQGMVENETGYENGRHLSGWCFMIKRILWEKIGGFDDCVDFWCSDDVVIEQLKQAKVKPMLVASSIVKHKASTTLKTVPSARRDALTWRNVDIFNNKYNQRKFEGDPRYERWKQRNATTRNRA